jgi:outer membrane protein TolC
MHSTATPYRVSQLSTPHVYSGTNNRVLTAKSETPARWWDRFHDATLNECITIALADSPTMQIAKSRIDKACQLSQAAGASLWPSVEATGYVERERFATFGLVPPPFNGHTFNMAILL